MRFLAALSLCLLALPAAAQTDDRFPSWGNRMTGHQPAKEWQWKGIASVYAVPGKDRYAGRTMACGGRANPNALTAAHRTLPCGSRVRVTNTRNGKSVVLTIRDRGPFVRGRVIDVTPAGARALGFSGLAAVTIGRI